MMNLQVYVAADCWSCKEAYRIVDALKPQFPHVEMEMLDMENVIPPDNVFATPTYLLNGRVIFLGNPTRAELGRKLQESAVP